MSLKAAVILGIWVFIYTVYGVGMYMVDDSGHYAVITVVGIMTSLIFLGFVCVNFNKNMSFTGDID